MPDPLNPPSILHHICILIPLSKSSFLILRFTSSAFTYTLEYHTQLIRFLSSFSFQSLFNLPFQSLSPFMSFQSSSHETPPIQTLFDISFQSFLSNPIHLQTPILIPQTHYSLPVHSVSHSPNTYTLRYTFPILFFTPNPSSIPHTNPSVPLRVSNPPRITLPQYTHPSIRFQSSFHSQSFLNPSYKSLSSFTRFQSSSPPSHSPSTHTLQ